MKMRSLSIWILAAVLGLAVVVVACGGGDSDVDPQPTAAPTMAATASPATALPTPEATPVPVPVSGNIGSSIGDTGADFTVASVDGEEINLYSLRGSPVVLYYFATW